MRAGAWEHGIGGGGGERRRGIGGRPPRPASIERRTVAKLDSRCLLELRKVRALVRRELASPADLQEAVGVVRVRAQIAAGAQLEELQARPRVAGLLARRRRCHARVREARVLVERAQSNRGAIEDRHDARTSLGAAREKIATIEAEISSAQRVADLGTQVYLYMVG